MPYVNKYSRERAKYIDRQEKRLSRAVKSYQVDVWSRLQDDFFSKLNTKDGKIKSSAGNMSLLGRLSIIQRKLQRNEKKDLVSGIVEGVVGQIDQVQKYFHEVKDYRDAVDNRVKKLTLRRIGYDGEGFVEYGALHDVWKDGSVTRDIQSQAVKAMSGGVSRRSFMKKMQGFVMGAEKQGVAERHIYTAVRDIYSQNDATLSKQYSDQLDLDYFIYQGGLIKTSRRFCKVRNNNIYTRKEIEDWETIDFQGKPDVYDPFVDRGGYNCRHQLDPISDELAEELK